MKRRDFIAGLGSAAAWPRAAWAQQGERVRQVGVLIEFDESDPEANAYFAGFALGLAQLGWIDGRNLRIDVRWASGSVERMRRFAKELVDLQPDVILGSSTPVTAALQRETQIIPIVFVTVADPLGSGFVASLPRPGGNLTGFINMEASMGGKCVELLTEIAPRVKRVAIMFNPDTAPSGGRFFLASFEAAAQSLNIELITAPVRSDAEIETAITSFAGRPNGGVILMPDGYMVAHRLPIITQAARNNLPSVGGLPRIFARDGGLLSFGADIGDLFHRAVPYVDRILRGAKPNDLPVQLPVNSRWP